jgi:hypothetical protein
MAGKGKAGGGSTENGPHPVLLPPGVRDENQRYTQTELDWARKAGVREGTHDGVVPAQKERLEIHRVLEVVFNGRLNVLLEKADIDSTKGYNELKLVAGIRRKNVRNKAEIANLAVKVYHAYDEAHFMLLGYEWEKAIGFMFEVGRLLALIEIKVPRVSLVRLIYEARDRWRRDPKGFNGPLNKEIVYKYGDQRLTKLYPKRIQNLISEFRCSHLCFRNAQPASADPADFYDSTRGA